MASLACWRANLIGVRSKAVIATLSRARSTPSTKVIDIFRCYQTRTAEHAAGARLIKKKKRPVQKGPNRLITAGLPFVLFSLLAAWVVSNALSGKLKEREKAHGMESKSIRQAELEAEHDEMMERLNKIVKEDFDNTKRIKRPEEILEERRLERERRNRWHRRLYRWITRQE